MCAYMRLYKCLHLKECMYLYIRILKGGGSLFRSDCMEIILLYVFQFHLIEQREEKLFIQQ